MEYDDGLIACTTDALVIRRYGLLLREKRIPYSTIRGVRQVRIGTLRRWRLWGTTDPRRWFNLDPGRAHKTVGFIVDDGRNVTPVITPDDPDRLLGALRSHNVPIDERH
jgi:hypothetical protein